MNNATPGRLLKPICGPRTRKTVRVPSDGSSRLGWMASIPGRLWHSLLGMSADGRWLKDVGYLELTAGLLLTRNRSLRRLSGAMAEFHSKKSVYKEVNLMHVLQAPVFRIGIGEVLVPVITQVEDPGRVLFGSGFIVEPLA